jgi:hypothetical protein
MFQVHLREDVSVADLLRQKAMGASVMKTPHVGSWYPNNLAMAQLGISMNVYDRTYGKADRNFHPHTVVQGGMAIKIGAADQLMTHARAHTSHQVGTFLIKEGELIANRHMDSLRKVMPDAELQRFTSYLQQHGDVVLQMAAVTFEVFSRMWTRYVDVDGTVHERQVTSWKTVAVQGVYGLNGNEQGWIIPNVLNVLITGVIEARETNRTDVWHLSGPDMYRYIGKYHKPLETAYERIVEAGLSPFGEIHFHLIPIADMRFTVPMSKREQLDVLVDMLLAVEYNEQEYSDRIRSAIKSEKQTVIETVKVARTVDRDRLRHAIADCMEVRYDIYQAAYWSQYDMLVTGEGLYIHPWGIEATPKQLRWAMKLIDQYTP